MYRSKTAEEFINNDEEFEKFTMERKTRNQLPLVDEVGLDMVDCIKYIIDKKNEQNLFKTEQHYRAAIEMANGLRLAFVTNEVKKNDL